MFDFVQNNKIIIRVILGAVALTFIGFGIGSYSAIVDDPYIAKVENNKIYQHDLDRALENQPAQAANRQTALDGLIRRELLLTDAEHSGLVVSAARLQQAILAIPEFQENGKFSDKRYREFLESRHITAKVFESYLSRDILIQAQAAPFLQNQIVSRNVTDRIAALLGESRQVSSLLLKPQAFASDINTDEAVLQTYYRANAQRFKSPESVKLDYVVLAQEQLAKRIVVSDAELADYYRQHKAEWNTEERRASHILLTVPQGAKPEEKVEIRTQAQRLLQELRAHPGKFAQLARQYSQDPGSAQQGGDLGFFAPGVMTKPFNDAVFSMKPGQISQLVTTTFGYHIIQLNDIKVPDFAALKPQLLERVQLQKAVAQYRQMVEKLSDLAYQQSDSLKAIQDALALPVQQSHWISRTALNQGSLLNHPKVLEAAFSDDVLQKKHNSEPLDIGNHTLVVIRVAAHQPETIPKFIDVKERIRAEVIASEGAKLAQKHGQAMLAQLKAGKSVDAAWEGPQLLSRQTPSELPPADMRAIFALGGTKVPAFIGIKHNDGNYVLYRVEKKTAASVISAAQRSQLTQLLARINTYAQMEGYLQSLYQKYPSLLVKS